MASTWERCIQTAPAVIVEIVNMRLGLQLGAVVGSLAAASVVRGAARPLDPPSIAVSSLSSSPIVAASFPRNEGRRWSGCFPALSFKMPKDYVPESIDDWWCDQENEYAFMGFSYEVTACECVGAVMWLMLDNGVWDRSESTTTELRF